MTTNDQSITQTSQNGSTTSNRSLVLDKSKTSEQYIREAEGIYIVPIIIRERYPDLIKLIVETESMDTEEREYWLSIMPVMNEDQIIKLRNILLNEKEQLFKIEQQYQQQGKTSSPAIDEEKLRERIERIQEAERSVEAEERQREEELFRMLEEV